MSCSHRLPLAISFPSPLRKSVSPHPPLSPSLPCQSPSFPFLRSLSSYSVNIPRPGPLSLRCFSPLSFSLFQFLCWIPWGPSPKCLSLSAHLLPSAFQSTFSRLLTPLTGGRGMPQGAQISRRCKLQCFFQTWAKFGQILTKMIKDASLTESLSCLWQSSCSPCRARKCYQMKARIIFFRC